MNKKGFVSAVRKALQQREKHNKLTLEKLASGFGIADRNLVKELIELAIVNEGRAIAHQPGKSITEKYADIVSLYKSQVNLSHRTSQSVMLQQYSTPAPIGYLMGIFCGVDRLHGVFLEPSAGNGLLTIAGNPEQFSVNEIDPVRNENLKTQGFHTVFQEDATKPLGFFRERRYDAVLTNPPFGRLNDTVEFNGYAINDLDHLMAIRALEGLKNSGRAAIIIGGHTSWDDKGRVTQGKNRIFFNFLHKHYYVLDTILVDGHALYSRQGTAFDVRLILIDGRKAIPEGVAPLKNEMDTVISDFQELFDRVMRFVPVRNDMKLKLKLRAKAAKVRLGILKSLSGFQVDEYYFDFIPEAIAFNESRPEKLIPVIKKHLDEYKGRQFENNNTGWKIELRRETIGKWFSKKLGDVKLKAFTAIEGIVHVAVKIESTGNVHKFWSIVRVDGKIYPFGFLVKEEKGKYLYHATLIPVEKNAIETEKPSGLDGFVLSGCPFSFLKTGPFETPFASPKLQNSDQNSSEELGMPYIPASQICNSLDVDTPDSMGYEIHTALKKLKFIVGNLEDYVQQKLAYKTQDELCNALSAEQADAVAIAIYNIEQRSQALIVGDQTGIGKGRIAAAMVRYGRTQGMRPIFITEKPNLFSDLYRDLKAIGSETLKPYIVNTRESKTHIKDEDGNIIFEALDKDAQTKIIDSGNLPKDFDYVVLTYSQISGGEVDKKGNLIGKSKKGSWVERIAQGNIIVMDEAHNASGDSNTGKILQDIIRATKGVTFLSATFAKRPDNMPIYAMKTAMSEANMSKNDLVEGIEKGGIALQEVLSAQLVQHGQMIRRERSFEGIEVNYITLDEKADEHKAISDNITQIVRDIISFQKNFIDVEVEALDSIAAKTNTGTNIEKRAGTKGAGVDATPYFSKVFQVINQMLFSIKADAVAERAIARLKEGKKPVIAFSSTMGSFIESLVDADGKSQSEDGTKINADFATVLQKGLDGVLRYTERDETGKSVYKSFDVSELSPEAQTEYNRIAEQIRNISSGIVISPIDWIKQKLMKAGYRVAEVTGRKLEVELTVSKERSSGLIKSRKKENTNDAFRKFQNNEVDVLMINQSGSTGASAHALPTKNVRKEQVRQRVMILLQAELDINTEVQKRGRINRTGQIFKPIYDYVFSAIPAEKRLMMMLQKKLKSLDANTTSNQKQSEAVLSVDDFLNKIGDRVVTGYLRDNPEINDLLDDPLKLNESQADSGSKPVIEDAAHRVSGRVAVLPTTMQEKFYTAILKHYKDEVEYLKQVDEYDLEVDVLDLKSVTLDKSIKIVGKGGQSAFGDNTYIEKCEINILKKPYSVVELENIYNQALEGKSSGEIRDELVSRYEYTTGKNLEKLQNDIRDEYAERLKNITSEKAYNSLNTDQYRKDFVEKRTTELNQARDEKFTKETEKANNRSDAMLDILKFFSVGRKLAYPLDMENEGSGKSMAVSLGVRVDLNNEKPFLPSNMKLQIAIASSKKRIDIPLSKIKDINAIMGASASLYENYDFEEVKHQWASAIKANTSDRGIAYIVTGNLLQSYGDDSFNKGRLISYTTLDGKTLKGRLMPDGWEPVANQQGQNLIKVPILKALNIIQSLGYGKSMSTDSGAIIARNADHNFKLMVSSSRSAGGDIYLDQELNALMDTGRFDKISNFMVANFSASKIKDVVEIFQRNHNASVELIPGQLDLIIDAIALDKGVEQIASSVIKEVAEKIEERKEEQKDEGPKTNVLRLRLALKAKAVKLKLKLAA